MKKGTTTLAVATAVLSLPLLAVGQTSNLQNQNSQNSPAQSQWSQSESGINHRSAMMEAQRMVPVIATLNNSLDAQDMHPGQTFTARLSKDVTLSNGTKLQDGAQIVGKVVKDNMQEQGTSKLALRITRIEMQNGRSIPVKATIVGVYTTNNRPHPFRPGARVPNNWNNGILQVDQINVMDGVDLHSKIGSNNSGVFVAKNANNVTLSAGTELQLAVTPRGNSSQTNMPNTGE